jgi:hypothetical protein
MLKGFNSDVEVQGQSYHLQTEDWGFNNPYIVSRVYKNGAVLKSVKTPYIDFMFSQYDVDEMILKQALREQHQKILDLLLSGQL